MTLLIIVAQEEASIEGGNFTPTRLRFPLQGLAYTPLQGPQYLTYFTKLFIYRSSYSLKKDPRIAHFLIFCSFHSPTPFGSQEKATGCVMEVHDEYFIFTGRIQL